MCDVKDMVTATCVHGKSAERERAGRMRKGLLRNEMDNWKNGFSFKVFTPILLRSRFTYQPLYPECVSC